MKYISFIAFILLLHSCKQASVTNAEDYNAYLAPKYQDDKLSIQKEDLKFWQQRLHKDTGSFVDKLEVGYAYLELFHLKGDIINLHKGDSLIKRASEKLKDKDPKINQALAQAAITQHKFLQAEYYNETANRIGASPYTYTLVAFDANMELGKYYAASKNISSLKDQTSFNYLIRKAKYEDHLGNLDKAIELMEEAFEKVKNANVSSIYCWSLSNLADMYGHAGRIEDAYNAYLNVLEKDPSYLYALKGIAWIAFAHDKNTAEAKRILNFILSQTNIPDLYLILAEIEELDGREEAAKNYIRHFLSLVDRPEYGDMYNKYLIEIFSEDNQMHTRAFEIAQKETAHRPTPETFGGLAWVYYRKGDSEKAKEIYTNYVKGRSFEPDLLLKGAYILKATGKNKEAKDLFKECLQSSFELGPIANREIKKELSRR